MKNFYFNTNLNIAKELLKEIITKHKNNDLKLEHKDNKVILYDYTKQSIYKITLPETEFNIVFMLEKCMSERILYMHVKNVPVNSIEYFINNNFEVYRNGCGEKDDMCQKFALASNCENCKGLLTHFIKRIN